MKVEACKVVEQWIFDYYTYKVIASIEKDGKIDNSSRDVLKALIEKSTQVNEGNNRLKANLLIIVSHLEQLQEIELAKFPWPEKTELMQSKHIVVELLELLDELQIALTSLENNREIATDCKLVTLCRKCRTMVYVFIIQITETVKRLQVFSETQVDEWMSKTLHNVEACVDQRVEEEKKILIACQHIVKGDMEMRHSLPQPQQLCSDLYLFVSHMYSACVHYPKLLQVAERNLKDIKTVNKSIPTGHRTSKFATEAGTSRKMSSPKWKVRKAKAETPDARETDDDSESEVGSNTSGAQASPSKMRKKTSYTIQIESSDSETDGASSRCTTENASVAGSPSKGKNTHKRAPHRHRSRVKIKTTEVNFPVKYSQIIVKHGRWTLDEEEQFIISVLKIGPGAWSQVKHECNSRRTTVQLKDKWRNVKRDRVEEVARRHNLRHDRF